MKKVLNPFAEMDGHNCFGCSPKNPYGLKLNFRLDGNIMRCSWLPDENFQGYKNVLHGGIQSTIMDEIASWSVFVLLKTAGVTSRLEINYKRPCIINGKEISLTAEIQEIVDKTANIFVNLFDSAGNLCSVGNVYYYTFDSEKAIKKLKYPGIEKFFNE